MADLVSMLTAYRQAKRSGLKVALATVVRVVGSAYRHAGARMLIMADGRTVGSISGGCLERDVAIRTQALIQSNTTAILHYSTMGSDDVIIFGLGVGCNGSVEILVEPVSVPDQIDTLEFLNNCYIDRQPAVLGTIIGGAGIDDTELGSVIAVRPDFNLIADRVKPAILQEAIEGARRVLDLRCSEIVSICSDAQQISLFLEFIQPPIKLLICGAGADAVPVSTMAKQLGWNVVIADPRPEYARAEHFPLADRVVCGDAASVAKEIASSERTAVLIMTHNYSHDLDYLRRSMISDAAYIGLLGPKQRTIRLLQELKTDGISPTPEQFERLHAPVGLDIGAETEEEIALSAVSEVQAAMSSRAAGFLRDKKGSIHADRHLIEIVSTDVHGGQQSKSWSAQKCPLD